MAKNTYQVPQLHFDRPTRGLMFIGDPHVWSKTPGRRLDNYPSVIMNKLAAAAEIANAQDLWPVCLGDLLHQANDNNLSMLSRLIEVLRLFDRPFLCAVGNHDLTERELTRGTALELLEQAQALRTLRHNAPYATLDLVDEQAQTQRVLLGATPYGEPIPASLAAWTGLARAVDHEHTKKALGVAHSIWITHEDLAFDHRYPGARDTHAMTGVDMVINGHMHLAQTPIRQAQTAWYNPGNISRLTIDLAQQAPRVWKWTPNNHTMKASDGLDIPLLEGIDLPIQSSEEVLSLEGRAAKQAQLEGLSAAPMEPEDPENTPATGIASSRFVERLREDQSQRRTDDGAYLTQTVQDTLQRRQPPEQVSTIIERLLSKALEQHRN